MSKGKRFKAEQIVHKLREADVLIGQGLAMPEVSEFTAKVVRDWLTRVGVKTLYIEPGSLWENGYIESFNGKLRDELLNPEVFETLLEAKVLIQGWRPRGWSTTRSDRTVHWAIVHRPPKRSCRVCQPPLRYGRQTRFFGTNRWINLWGQVSSFIDGTPLKLRWPT